MHSLDDEQALQSQPGTFVSVGNIVAPRGLRGEMRMTLADPSGRDFLPIKRVYLGEAHTPFVVQRARLFQGQGLLVVEGIPDRDSAETWRTASVYIATQDLAPLEKDEYYRHQIMGLAVYTVEGELLGRVTEILVTGANDVYVVQGSAGEILIPAIKDVIIGLDLPEDRMLVRLLDGLR